MVATVLVGRGQQAVDCCHTRTGDARFAFILVTVAVGIDKHLANDIAAIRHRVGHDTYRCRRDTGGIGGQDIVVHHCLVNVFAFADTTTND